MSLCLLLLLCSHSPNDVPPEPEQNVSIAAIRGAVRLSKKVTVEINPLYIVPFLNFNERRKANNYKKP